ncbi:hypothetical protein N752_26760 [Desulforamulus aquiferis]|nr:hypothetical protein N752_26760 [Desulforamulus aquiferis]
MLEENVVRAAGVNYRVALKEILHCISSAGFTPARGLQITGSLKSFSI